MSPSVLRLARLFVWIAAVSGVLVVAMGYAALPAELPVTRWTSAAKTPLLALRVPLINLLSLLCIVLLERPLARSHAAGPWRENAMMTLTALFGTLGVKAVLEAFEILRLPAVDAWMPWVLAAVIAGGLSLAAVTGLPLWRGRGARLVEDLTGREKAAALLLFAMILALQFFPV